MTGPRKPRVVSPPAGFTAYIERFKAEFPDDWEALRLCPLQHGLEDMARKLKD